MSGRPLLALDSASPTVGVALAHEGEVLASEREGLRSSSRRLLAMIDGCLRAADAGLEDLAGIVVLAGPGSFTGLRVGMATILGLHQATGVAATTLPTLEALALGTAGAVVTGVDVLRGEWAAQPFRDGAPLAEAERLPADDIVALAADRGARLRGYGISALTQKGDGDPEDLAEQVARHSSLAPPPWDPAGLLAPLYFRPPATTRPGPPKRLLQFRKA